MLIKQRVLRGTVHKTPCFTIMFEAQVHEALCFTVMTDYGLGGIFSYYDMWALAPGNTGAEAADQSKQVAHYGP
eukprot:12405002-Karenia_brevis.AAC.1